MRRFGPFPDNRCGGMKSRRLQRPDFNLRSIKCRTIDTGTHALTPCLSSEWRRKRWRACSRSMSACHATLSGKGRPSTPLSGRRPFKAAAWRGGSISTGMGKAIWRGMAASTGPSLSIRSSPTAIGKPSSAATTSAMGSSERISRSTGCPMAKCASAITTGSASALFEVTQPRVTCYRVGIRMNEPQMAALLVSHGRPGFYFRVLEEGEVGAGDEIVKVEAGPERMTVAEINALLYLPGHPASRLERALRIPALSAGWRNFVPGAARPGTESGGATTGNPGLGPSMRPAPGMARLPPVARVAEAARKQQCHLANARACRRTRR